MVVVFLCIYCAKIVHNNKRFPRQEAPNISRMHSWQFLSSTFLEMAAISVQFFQCIRPNFDAKMTKSKWNYTANMIMNVSGTVCQRMHYFPGKQGLAINLTWPALKVNTARAFWYHQLMSVDSHLVGIWSYYKVHNKKNIPFEEVNDDNSLLAI